MVGSRCDPDDVGKRLGDGARDGGAPADDIGADEQAEVLARDTEAVARREGDDGITAAGRRAGDGSGERVDDEAGRKAFPREGERAVRGDGLSVNACPGLPLERNAVVT